MRVNRLVCPHSRESYPPWKPKYYCVDKSPLEVQYDYRTLKKVSWKKLRDRPFNHYRYKEFLPNTKHKVSLNEGGTALVQGKKNLWFKLESQNPSGAFKDRGSACEISHAKDLGAKKIVCASTGNMGASVAAYSARAGVDCTIVLPNAASGEKINQIQQHGARLKKLKGDYTAAMKEAYSMYKSGKYYLCGDYAYRLEGEKTVGMEIVDQLSSVEQIILPIGNGTLLAGMWKGLTEMKRARLIRKLPRMVGVQAKGCSPVYKAWKTGKPIKPVIPKTIAGAIACGDPIDGELAIHAVKESKGSMYAVNDKEILAARKELASTQGIDGEPSALVPYAAYKKMRSRKKTVLVVTGHGLKDLKHR